MMHFTAPPRDGMELQEYVELIVTDVVPFHVQKQNIGYRDNNFSQPIIILSPKELAALIREALEGWDEG